jgi:PPOX class probable F420-dependent enzyme
VAELDPAVRELLEGANFISLATLTADGSPHATTLWGAVEDGRPCFFTQPSSFKARNIDRDPRVGLTVFDRENPYRTGQLRGRPSCTPPRAPPEGVHGRRTDTRWSSVG